MVMAALGPQQRAVGDAIVPIDAHVDQTVQAPEYGETLIREGPCAHAARFRQGGAGGRHLDQDQRWLSPDRLSFRLY
ncbi:hypothetical protein IQ07DRAFT_399596 [Pyrenochaeta sp. DS3sAY3a]|nr:hypothetical protein IQ07DRAFT_399596 [Pyrenochaeta sp. DS3sAY3a]